MCKIKSAKKLSGVCPTVLGVKYVDNNDTISYGCIRVALELQPSVRKMQPSQKKLDKLEFIVINQC